MASGNLYVVGLHFLALSMHGLASPPPATKDNVGCVVEMEIPRYSALARLALRTGTVEALIRIGKRGEIGTIKTHAPDPRLEEDVEAWLKNSASFRPSCQGRQVRLLFTYRLEGEPTQYPFAVVRFRPPNHFVIISQPRLPNVDPAPTDATRGKSARP